MSKDAWIGFGSLVVLLVLGAGVYLYMTYMTPVSLLPGETTVTKPASMGTPLPNPFGLVTAKDDTTITFTDQDGAAHTVRVTSATKIVEGTTAKKLSDISVGTLVSVSLKTGVITIIPPLPKPKASK